MAKKESNFARAKKNIDFLKKQIELEREVIRLASLFCSDDIIIEMEKEHYQTVGEYFKNLHTYKKIYNINHKKWYKENENQK